MTRLLVPLNNIQFCKLNHPRSAVLVIAFFLARCQITLLVRAIFTYAARLNLLVTTLLIGQYT
ncbi:hypothetical protein BDV40DRAFT_282012 [Aspergillus tamarii]|uniref:Uncharacterized protein n=1 Tax=Aspergillus tamarii TaxID=41984 RepID=A0A5N6UC48_ASPTM|nr:hypothetical protein BDV40DRAFT_282012 [Aspergillus tamarii]